MICISGGAATLIIDNKACSEFEPVISNIDSHHRCNPRLFNPELANHGLPVLMRLVFKLHDMLRYRFLVQFLGNLPIGLETDSSHLDRATKGQRLYAGKVDPI